ncbi:MAG TPA: IS1634 family transposase [Burkholderiales bacterium]|nr:IS1634 family transposase [Burkholderiales bacterium]
MPRRGGKVHIATTRRHYKGNEYTTTLLRRSYREGGKVKNETLGNLSHLPAEVIDGLRAMLAGRRLVDLDQDFEILRSLPHGHVAAVLGVLRDLGLERLIARERCRERDLVVAMICQRLLDPCSKLSTTRLVHQTTLALELELGDVGDVGEAELLAAMDWLYARQERIEAALARRHLQGEGYVLYDLSSSYVEGRCCELAEIGYSRDGKPGKAQISYGLCCAPEGQPVSIEVHAGNTGDPTTLSPAVERLKDRFGIEHLVFVGDRGMITEARIKVLKEQGVGFITALRAPQIQALTLAPDFQLSLFDERGLCEVSSPQFAGERLIICRNPAVAAERARKREELLARTEQDLAKVKQMVDGERGKLKHASAGKIGERAGRVVNRRKMAKHFTLQISDGSFDYQRNEAQIDQEALFDGIYVIRTAEPQQRIGSEAVVRAYKQLKVNERAFRTMKTPLEIRPIYHRLEDRVRAHAFICMLACYVQFELERRLAPLLYTDDTPLSAADPVAPASRSPQAAAKAGSGRTANGHVAHSLEDLLSELGTLCRNDVRIGEHGHTFPRLTTATELQASAFELLAITPK